jgi:hypothetical protein
MQQQQQEPVAAILNEDRQEYLRNIRAQFEQQDQEVREWNSSRDVQDQLRARSNLINNTDNYQTGNDVHHLRTVQMVEVEVWQSLFRGRAVNHEAIQYAFQIMREYNNPDTEFNTGNLQVSLLLEENVRPGVHEAIFMIHVTPHCATHHGHMVRYEFEEGSQQQQIIEAIFDINSPATIVEQCNEFDILSSLACEYEMQELLHGVFLQGMNSKRFPGEHYHHDCSGLLLNLLALGRNRAEEEEEEEDDAIAYPYQVPPPPRVNDFAEIYRAQLGNDGGADADAEPDADADADALFELGNQEFDIWADIAGANAAAAADNQEYGENNNNNYQAAVARRREENRRAWENIDVIPGNLFEHQGNIIGYWLQNNDRINQLMDIREGERRVAEAAAPAEAYAPEDEYMARG